MTPDPYAFCFRIGSGEAIPEKFQMCSFISPPPNTEVLTNGAEPSSNCVVGAADKIDKRLTNPSANFSSPENLSGSLNNCANT